MIAIIPLTLIRHSLSACHHLVTPPSHFVTFLFILLSVSHSSFHTGLMCITGSDAIIQGNKSGIINIRQRCVTPCHYLFFSFYKRAALPCMKLQQKKDQYLAIMRETSRYYVKMSRYFVKISHSNEKYCCYYVTKTFSLLLVVTMQQFS